MKTPKRKYYFYDSGINPENGDIIRDPVMPLLYDSRWKRKNRTAQYKRTIERLARKNHEMGSIMKTIQRIIEVALAPDTTELEIHFKWENAYGRKEATRKARLERRAHRRACHAKTAENAKQATLTCMDAKQLENRKGHK